MAAGDTLVLQSHRRPLPHAWLERCLASVRSWAARHGFHYRFEGDELFERLSPALRRRTAGQPVVAADLARLAAAQQALQEGFAAVVWMDADMLVIDPAELTLPAAPYALGREVWVQTAPAGQRVYVKVHNAFLLFRVDNPFLPFYRHAAENIVLAHRGPMAPQLVGPKLLTALHNLVGCPVAERFAMLSPLVARDLLAAGGPALAAFRRRSPEPPGALNLCASLAGAQSAAMDRVIDVLLRDPALLRRRIGTSRA